MFVYKYYYVLWKMAQMFHTPNIYMLWKRAKNQNKNQINVSNRICCVPLINSVVLLFPYLHSISLNIWFFYITKM